MGGTPSQGLLSYIDERPEPDLPVHPFFAYRIYRNREYYGGVDTFLNALTADWSLFAGEILLAQDRRNELLAVVQSV